MRPDDSPFAKYRLGDLTLASELALPELPISTDTVDWTLRVGAKRARPPCDGWFHYWDSPQGRRWLSFGRDADAYLLRFARTATFRLAPARGTIVCEGATRVPARTVRHLLLNQVMPLALSRDDRTVLHASGVVDGGGVIAFAGAAGSGKSTLSAACALAGFPLVSDDALVVRSRADGRPAVVPIYGSARLWPDAADALFGRARKFPAVSHYTRKRLVSVGPAPGAMHFPLHVIGLLAPPARIRRSTRLELRPLSPRDALIRLTRLVFQLDVHDSAAVRIAFDRLASLVSRVPAVEIVLPWGLSRVHDTALVVVEALRAYRP